MLKLGTIKLKKCCKCKKVKDCIVIGDCKYKLLCYDCYKKVNTECEK